jgi:tetratricopeptide (TPR) repeat protein
VLEQTINALQAACRLLETSSSSGDKDRLAEDALPSCLLQLASAYASRYMHTADLKDLEEQITCCEAILAKPKAAQHHETASQLLAVALRNRFQQSQDPQDINRSVDLLETLLNRSSQRSAHVLSHLGRSLRDRFQWNSNLVDLDEAVKLQEQSLEMHPTRDYELAEYQISLAGTLLFQYTKFGALDVLQRCKQLGSESLALQEGHRDRPISLNLLAAVYMFLANRSGDPAGHDRAIECFEEVLTLLGKSHPRYPRTLNNLAMALQHRYIRRRSLSDLNRSIETLRESLSLISATSHYERHGLLANLSIALFDRFDIVGNLEDEDDSIALGREALGMLPHGHVNRQRALGYLSNHLSQRYRRTESQQDMTEAMSLHEELVSSFSPGEQNIVYEHALIHFGDFLIARHHFTGSHEDLDRAISLHEHLFEKGITEPLVKTECFHSAAEARLRRFRLSHDEVDLANAIEKLEAVSAIIHPQLYAALHDLSNALQLRFQMNRSVDDIETAIKHQTAALECVPIGHPGRSRILYGFARIHSANQTPYHDLPLALEHAAAALLDPSSSVQSRVHGFLELLPDLVSAASQHEEANAQLLNVFRHALQLLPQMAFLGLDVRERLRMLKQTEHLATLSAGLALRLGKARDAVEVLEEGRAVFWTQYLRLRTKFDLLPPHLSEELVRLARQIEQATHRFKRQAPDGDSDKDRAAEDAAVVANRQLAVRFESLVKEARSLPGLERFLLHDPYPTLARAAEHCPVVVLLASDDCCAAIVVRGSKAPAEHVALTGVTAEQLGALSGMMQNVSREVRNARNGRAMRQLRPKGDGATRALRSLWEHIAKPLVTALGFPVRDAP